MDTKRVCLHWKAHRFATMITIERSDTVFQVKRLWSKINKRALRWVALLLIALVAGPEIGIGLEATALLDLMGAELFLLAFGGAHVILFWGHIKNFCEHIDPYFFIPTSQQIAQVPGIVVHAIPIHWNWAVKWIVLFVMAAWLLYFGWTQ